MKKKMVIDELMKIALNTHNERNVSNLCCCISHLVNHIEILSTKLNEEPSDIFKEAVGILRYYGDVQININNKNDLSKK